MSFKILDSNVNHDNVTSALQNSTSKVVTSPVNIVVGTATLTASTAGGTYIPVLLNPTTQLSLPSYGQILSSSISIGNTSGIPTSDLTGMIALVQADTPSLIGVTSSSFGTFSPVSQIDPNTLITNFSSDSTSSAVLTNLNNAGVQYVYVGFQGSGSFTSTANTTFVVTIVFV